MKKVLDFLESNVQWVALGLGVIYVLWMAWSYMITSPVAVTVNNTPMSPGQVDRYIVQNVVTELESRISHAGVPRMDEPKWVAAFQENMSYKGREAVALANPMFPINLTTEPLQFGNGAPERFAEVPVEALPKPPAAMMMEARTGMSNVVLPDQLAAAPDHGLNAAAVQPVIDEQQDPAQQQGRDILWVTHTFRIPMVELASAFREVKIPPVPAEQYLTTIADVTVEREELAADGSWGKLTTVRPLPTVQRQPIPPDKSPVGVKTVFLQWANNHPVDIMQPPFYTVLRGDAWGPPGIAVQRVVQDQPQAGQADQPFDAKRYLDAPHSELMTLTPEQRAQVAMERRKRDDEERKRKADERKGNRSGGPGVGGGGLGGGPAGGGGGRGGGPGGFGPNDGGRGDGFVDPGSFEGGGMGAMPEMAPTERPMGPEQQQQQQQQGQQPNMADFPIPGGEFDPRQTPDAICWFHDDTVEAGKTYRYRVTYQIKSPVWNTNNITKPQELADAFLLKSAHSAWGEPVTVPSLSNFWVVRPAMGGNSAQVQVFRWAGGQLRTKLFDVSPGDAVGATDSENGVDFSTGWTMVDMGMDPRTDQRYVLLMDPNGRLSTRDFRSDANDPEFKKMQAEAAQAAASAGGSGDTVAGTR
jgi:uncharacterized membrane protein YgcG